MDITNLIPEIILISFALGLLVVDFLKPRAKNAMMILGLAAVIMGFWSVAQMPLSSGGFFAADGLSFGFSLLVLLGVAATLAMAWGDNDVSQHWGSYLALMLFATIGCLLLIKARDFAMAFLAIELISISSFVLVGFERRDLASTEGALKYFVFGAFSSAIALYGISLYYAATGTTAFIFTRDLGSPAMSLVYFMALFLIFASFGFKASIVPFHYWVPDAYQAAPTPVTAYLSVVPKLATFAVMVNVFNKAIPATQAQLQLILAALACLTMTVGNVSAIAQNNLKRLFAYSSIAQAGYMLIGLLAVSNTGMSSILFYGFAYMLMNFGAFTCVLWLAGKYNSYDINICDGLARRHLMLALGFTLFLLSLAGIPPLVGFVGKYYIFAGAIEAQWAWWVALIGALNSVISVYYYLRIAYRMFFVETEPLSTQPATASPAVLTATVAVLALGTLILGLYPVPLLILSNL